MVGDVPLCVLLIRYDRQLLEIPAIRGTTGDQVPMLESVMGEMNWRLGPKLPSKTPWTIIHGPITGAVSAAARLIKR
jgi:hypothetical protein